MNADFTGTLFWSHLLQNNWTAMSADLQLNYTNTNRI